MKKINEIIDKIKNNKWIHYAIIILIGIILSIPLRKIQFIKTHDGTLHLLRLIGTANTIKIGEFPAIIAPYFCNNYGYAMNLFYNPLVTYLPLIIKLFTNTYISALKIFASLCIILSGITMYKFVYKVTKKPVIALFSSIVYLIVPYKLSDVYVRFAIGEFAAFIFLPLLFNGMYSLFNENGKEHYLIAIGAIGLLLTHTITTYYTAIICIVYILFNLKKLKEKDVIKKLIINFIFIILITLFFTLPLFEAKQATDYAIFDSKVMSTNNNFVYGNTIDISEFFVKKSNDILGEKLSVTFIIGIPILIFMCLTFFTYKKVDIKYKSFYILSWIFSIISLYMSTKFCPWFIFPDVLCKLQYPWRMLTFFALFISFISGVNLYIFITEIFKKEYLKVIISIIVIVLCVIYTMPLILEYKNVDYSLDQEYEESIINNPIISHYRINREYLPLKAIFKQETYLKEREDKTYVLQGNINIINENKSELKDVLTINNIEEKTVLEFPFFYYPGYEIILETNEETIKLESMESDNGFVSAKIENNISNAKITVEYKGTMIIYISYIVSFISLIVFIIYIINSKNRKE